MVIFRNFETTTWWTIRLLWVLIAVNAVGVLSGIAEYRLIVDLESGSVDYDVGAAVEGNDLRQMILGGIQIAAWIAAAVTILVWIRQANLNARALGAAAEMRFTPNWSIGWYFIPIMNLWKPYQAMTEIWRASGYPGDEKSADTPEMFPIWWVAWLATTVLGRVSSGLAKGATELEDFRIASVATIAAGAAGIVLCFAFLDVVRELAARQSARAAVIGSPALDGA